MERLHVINGLSLELVLKIVKIINQIQLGESFYDLTYYLRRFFDFSECCLRASEDRENQSFLPCSQPWWLQEKNQKHLRFTVFL